MDIHVSLYAMEEKQPHTRSHKQPRVFIPDSRISLCMYMYMYMYVEIYVHNITSRKERRTEDNPEKQEL